MRPDFAGRRSRCGRTRAGGRPGAWRVLRHEPRDRPAHLARSTGPSGRPPARGGRPMRVRPAPRHRVIR